MNTQHPAPLGDSLKKYLTPIFDRKIISAIAIDVSQHTSYADTLVIVEAASSRQVRSVAEHVTQKLKQSGIQVMSSEGVKEGEWALLDYGDTIVHIFQTQTKLLYDLEGFWADAPRIDIRAFDQAQNQATDLQEDDDGF